MDKKCTKCLEIKNTTEFYKKSNGSFRPLCKKCHLEYYKVYRDENIENIKDRKKKYREENREKLLTKEKEIRDSFSDVYKSEISIYNREWREGNKEQQKEKKKIYYINNKDKFLKKSKDYRDKNKDKIKNKRDNNKRNEKRNEKRKNNILFLLECRIRSLFSSSFRKSGFSKKSRTHEILGCSYIELKLHLESKFDNWMNWDNRGLFNGELNYGWDIDHIIPISSAKTEDELIKLNHYTNLQPLCSYTNRYIKRNILN